MLADLLALFQGGSRHAALRPDNARRALAALMVRVARSDDDFSAEERGAILRELMRRHALPRAEASALLAEAERAEAIAPDTVRFTRLLKDAVAYEDRIDVIEALWRIVLADGVRAADEDALMRQIAPLLGVMDRDSGLARQRAGDAVASDID
jgi:uncharacterized tellurite resistance protein B-like protein